MVGGWRAGVTLTSAVVSSATLASDAPDCKGGATAAVTHGAVW
jgi:hypothetical protein